MNESFSLLFRLAFILLLVFCALLVVNALIPIALPLAIIVGVLCAAVIGIQLVRR